MVRGLYGSGFTAASALKSPAALRHAQTEAFKRRSLGAGSAHADRVCACCTLSLAALRRELLARQTRPAASAALHCGKPAQPAASSPFRARGTTRAEQGA